MIFDVLDILGTITFAISGVLTAFEKRLDTFGIFIIAFVTAVGGGTLRDVLIGNTPVGWMINYQYVYYILLAVVFAIVFRKRLSGLRKSMFLFDTIGLGVFTIIGIEKGLQANLNPFICIALGTMTASFGGVIRDILSNEIPVIFRKEVYATACIIGGCFFLMLKFLELNANLNYIVTALIIMLIRLLAVKYKLRLPAFYSKD